MNILQCALNRTSFNHCDLNKPKTLLIACLLAPLFFGLVSLWLGTDLNWDLQNYHVYNAFALLNGKLHTDLGPAGMQTYFNPILDVPYYWLSLHLPAPLVGFMMGAVHGINFILLAGICRKTLPDLPSEDRFRIPLLLAIVGCLTANFLSSIGNTMGDASTSIFILGSLLIVLYGWEKFSENGVRPILIVILAGSVAGLGTGLKLTNVVFAMALCLSFCTVQVNWITRFRLAFFFGVGVLIGIAATSGYWFFEMWRTFGNPFFPQFSTYFPNPLTRSVSVADVIWRPKNHFETLFWPFLFSLNPKRVGQLPLHQIIWPVVYVLFWCWLAAIFLKRKTRTTISSMLPEAKYIVAVVAIGYLIWMELFSIQRYLIPIEMCAPLVVFILLMQLKSYQKARKIAMTIFAVTTAVVLLGGLTTWGHASWAKKMFRIDLPPIAAPEKTTVILANGDPAYGWLAAQFPPNIAFTQIEGNFPGAMPAYVNRIHEIVNKRGGPIFAIVQGEKQSSRIAQITKIREIASGLGVTSTKSGCEGLRWIITRLKLHASVSMLDAPVDNAQCAIQVLASDIVDVEGKNKVFIASVEKGLTQNGFFINASLCKPYRAYIGDAEYPYQWCPLSQS
ncbi:hypothetical protein QN379_21085 [Glaciimonas sp. Gout2]|uniref:hypothetical protein n=1 Tax=unclassified Glaciimonas TaxID=2644401 RepID=UPI002AB47C3C|nr:MULTISPECIES: hypothetical protein [unclassified Glaciimonas]MDY7548580.1 hypothetical protein [Glaciimonas sp. CA11.2]MEB0013767.1 hypothetical protein [Glaciimonas sp. Cout2]MEB0084509.1 hypothetical protein [Glaciimonas sp. Gout2]